MSFSHKLREFHYRAHTDAATAMGWPECLGKRKRGTTKRRNRRRLYEANSHPQGQANWPAQDHVGCVRVIEKYWRCVFACINECTPMSASMRLWGHFTHSRRVCQCMLRWNGNQLYVSCSMSRVVFVGTVVQLTGTYWGRR
jgi:hypothetical protein